MIEDIYELSPIQKGMLFHALSEPHSPAYLNQLTKDGDVQILDPELKAVDTSALSTNAPPSTGGE